jgi:hypothetical protein
MNRELFLLCQQYVYCFGLIETLINTAGIEAERLKLFRLTQNRMRMLEQEMESCIIVNDLEKNKG